MGQSFLLQAILATIAKIMPAVLRMFSIILPDDWTNIEDVRRFALVVLSWLDQLASRTSSTVDDAVVDAAKKIVNNVEYWSAFYGTIVDILDGTEGYEGNTRIADQANKLGISPVVMFELFMLVLQAIQMWRAKDGEPVLTIPGIDDVDCPNPDCDRDDDCDNGETSVEPLD